MSDKVVLPREVADELDHERNFGKGNIDIISDILDGDSSAAINEYINRGGGTFDKLLSALVNGYTAEITPEEKVRDLYKSYVSGGLNSEAAAIRAAINLYGIRIEGVNA